MRVCVCVRACVRACVRSTVPHICTVLFIYEKGYNMTQLIAEADEDGTGGINLQEFCAHMRKRWVG